MSLRAQVRFAILPEWLLDAEVSDRAIRLYAILARYANTEGTAYPSRTTLAERMRCSVDTVDRAMKELVTTGAVEVEAAYTESGDRDVNRYTVLVVRHKRDPV
jgi:DNA-binding transcriptional MocR family regulator